MAEVENTTKLLNYIIDILEPKRSEFGNLPICPFARKERLKGKIFFKEALFTQEPTTEIINIIDESFKNSDDHTLLIYDTSSNLDVQEFVDYGKKLCITFLNKKIISISIHPEDTFNIKGQLTRTVPFHTMLVQSASRISEAKQILERSSYYKNWSKEDLLDNYLQFGQYL